MLDVFGLGADVTGEKPRQTHDDFACLIFVDQFEDCLRVGYLVAALEDHKRASDNAHWVRNSHPKPFIADVQTDDALKHPTVTL